MVNLVAVLVSAIVSMIIGFIWYGPLFGKTWMQAMGMTEAKMRQAKKGGMGKMYFAAFVGALVWVYVLSFFIGYAGATTLISGAMIGFWAWLGFVVTTHFAHALFEGKNMNVFYINMGHHLVEFLIIGALLAVWV